MKNHKQPLLTSWPIWIVVALPLMFASAKSSAQSIFWNGGSGSANASAGGNWNGGAAPSTNADYNFVFNLANLTNATTNRTSVSWNVANVGLLSLEFTGGTVPPVNSPGTNFTWTGTANINLKGGITVNSGDHTFNTTATVFSNATWNIASSSSLQRSANNNFTFGATETITKTGGGVLTINGINAGIAGTFLVQEGVLRASTADDALGGATLALDGGTLEVFSNSSRTNANTTTTVLSDSTVLTARNGNGAGNEHVLGTLQLGSSKLTVQANAANTSGTAGVIFGTTTLSNNATLEVVNNGVGTSVTQLTLGAVGETGGARGLTKTGDGQLLLNANNTYSGATVVSAGSLIIGAGGSVGSSSVLDVASGATLNVSAVTGGFAVGSSQTLRGSGTIVGNTTVNGALQPGNSPGLLTFNNDLTLGATAVTTMEVNSAATRGATFDAVNVVGLLTYGGNLTLSMGTTFGVGSYSFDLFDFNSTAGSFNTVTLGDLYSGSLVNDGGVWGLADGNDTWTFTQSSGLLQLNVVPEPSTYALLVLAAAGLGARVIRRRRRA